MTSLNKNLLSSFELSENKIEFLRKQSITNKIYILENSHLRTKKEILKKLNEDEILEIIKYLDPDQITDLLQTTSEKKKNKIITKLNDILKEKVNFLLKFSPKSAAGIMSVNYILIPIETSKKQILERIKNHIEQGKKEPTILIINSERKLIGELRISNILFNNKEKDIYSNIKQLPSIKYDEDQTEVISRFKEHKHEKIIVLDEKETVLGLIHARDIFKIIEEENTEDFYAISGLQKEEDITDSAINKVKYRFSWLLINLVTAFLAAFVVSIFEDTISKIVILAAFMPIVAGMGGNAGTQTVAILVRSLALKKIDSSLGKKILYNEILAGIINGILIGTVVGLIAFIYGETPIFGLVVGFAILANLIIASLFGTLIPLVLKTFGIDPASSSSVFVTTTTDVFGFLIFLGLATLYLI